MKQRSTSLLCLHMGPFGHLLVLITQIWITSCTLLCTFPTIPWEELIFLCRALHLPATTTWNLCIQFWLILPTTILVRILQWNCSCCVCGSFEVASDGLEYSAEDRNLGEICLTVFLCETEKSSMDGACLHKELPEGEKYNMWIKMLHLDIKFH